MRHLIGIALVATLAMIAFPVAAADYYDQTVSLPADGGFGVSTAISQGGLQLAVQSTLDVNYRVCERDTRADDGGSYWPDAGPVQGACIPNSNDLMIEANKILDVAMPSGAKYIGFARSDGGAPAVRVYRVNPRTLPE